MRPALGPMLLLLVAAGCEPFSREPPASAPTEEPPAEVAPASRFDPADTGTVVGRVAWDGPIPKVPAVKATFPLALGARATTQPNPNAPTIDPTTKAIAGAVVYLRGIDAARAKPWDLPPARVEMRDFRIDVTQGGPARQIGFVRRGDAVEVVSNQPVFHSLSARGAGFFGLAFPDPDRPASRRLTQPGLVELSSAAGFSWMRGYLFVDDHPYYARTDADGRFAFSRVPAGAVEVVAWLPNWTFAGHDRDPNTGIVVRLYPAPPLESMRPATVRRGATAEIALTVSVGAAHRAE